MLWFNKKTSLQLSLTQINKTLLQLEKQMATIQDLQNAKAAEDASIDQLIAVTNQLIAKLQSQSQSATEVDSVITDSQTNVSAIQAVLTSANSVLV